MKMYRLLQTSMSNFANGQPNWVEVANNLTESDAYWERVRLMAEDTNIYVRMEEQA